MKGSRIYLIAFLILLAPHQVALGATEVTESITADTIWTLSGSPYNILNSINIGSSESQAELLIEPGVEVKFAPGVVLNIFGDLNAEGEEGAEVKFNSSETDGTWRLNIFASTASKIKNIISESMEGTIAAYNSAIDIESYHGKSQLMLFDSHSSIKTIELNNNQLYTSGGIATIDNLNINGGVVNSYGTSLVMINSYISNTDNQPAIILTDTSANLENIHVDNASYGIIASNIPNLNIVNSSITNISSDAIIFNEGNINLNGLNIENTYYGAGLQGDRVNITNLHINNAGSPSLQVNASETNISESSFTNGENIGVSIDGGEANLNNIIIKNFPNAPALLPNTESLQGNRLIITDNLFGIYNYGTTTIKRSKIANNNQAGALNAGGYLDARDNYWGHPDGPTIDPMNPETIQRGDGVVGEILYEPWLTDFCETDCHSNIMFLPGIMSSRLYEDNDQIWEPGLLTKDGEFEKLYLDENGKSIKPNIVTKDVLDNEYAYGKFIDDLNSFKSTGKINDYEAVPYDWRLSMEDILTTGTKREDGTILYGSTTDDPYIESILRRLATNSKSGKVTIVAHSNGGLVTKALINKLGGEASELIDQIILVAVPQLGTPQTIGALLHGYEAGQPSFPYPFILTEERARDLAINMPMIYQLLPFADYYNSDGYTINTPYVTFEDGSATQTFIDEYGYAITPDELVAFLKGEEGRVMPEYDDLVNAVLANEALLAEAQMMQQAINSSWQPPAGIKVHQIAGTGEDTLASITYKTIQKCHQHNTFFECTHYENSLSYKAKKVIDGDGTVVAPSALAMTTNTDGTERWWVNLNTYNNSVIQSLPGFGFLKTKHADILEIDELRAFIFGNLITKETTTLPNYVTPTLPYIESDDRLHFTLHSPLSLGAIDEYGNVANANEITIPGASYQRYGEVQTLSIPAGTKFEIVLVGEKQGSFTLEMEEFSNDDLITSSTFSAIPSSTSSLVTISFETGSLQESGVLQLDYNGDSVVDVTYTPVLGQIVLTPDPIITPETTVISSGGRFRASPKVHGATTDTYLMLEQLKVAVAALTSLKGQVSDDQYNLIAGQISSLLEALLTQLIEQQGL